jgi:hypothetical protein
VRNQDRDFHDQLRHISPGSALRGRGSGSGSAAEPIRWAPEIGPTEIRELRILRKKMTRLRGSIASPKQSIAYGSIVLIIGIGIALAGGIYEIQFISSYQHSQKTSGHIVRLDLVNQTYHPVVEFTDINGKTVQFTDSQGSKPPQYAIGDKVQIVFPNGHPEQGKIDSLLATWVIPLLPLACSAFWLITGVAMLSSGISRLRLATK